MGIFNFFKKKPPVLFRCTHCNLEFELPADKVRLLEKKYCHDPVCQAKFPCDMCDIGFFIPVNYTNKHGNRFVFHQIKPKVKNLDPNTRNKRINQPFDPEMAVFSPFYDDD